ncbi:MAG: DNA-directed RNA polymerase subunit beta' [Candidatus Marinimicrobia bacterium]|nr:DNA-directed RNA polymerase subunit beta' [Candidatus Neomarinimicrobiota bacterium]|tara:strand:- start:14965 stop:19140 length:4176 start_codon:yes stop_codon:yes gene_type:complete
MYKEKNSISLKLASPEKILEGSFGEVLKPETINYRSYKPEKDGLFCEKIFGPVKDFECHCGKYKGIRYRGIICDRCGVEVTTKKVRRNRMGHITLAVPVVHIWFLKSIPSKLSYILGKSAKQLESVIYYENYLVINPGKSDYTRFDLIDEEEYLKLETEFGYEASSQEEKEEESYFYAAMGGEAIKDGLAEMDLLELKKDLELISTTTNSKQKKEDALKRLKVVKDFARDRNNKPEWMIVSILPVMPPELRPLVPLEGGRFAASDLNDLYRRIIIRNNRLKQLMDIQAPEVILRNEKRMLQESVDALFDNTKRKTAIRSGSKRPLKSISDMLRGKQGRFRQNLLGKRVDYSGRSVIVVGPELKMTECGIPKNMALELFKPHLIRELIRRDLAATPRSAKLMIENKESFVYEILETVVKDHPVLLNRAPTLHRLGIIAFQPILIDGKAIRVHPLVCSAFNADFDGDQMAVHVPLSIPAQLEARVLMMASQNVLHPASGKPITLPSQDMILGCYYLTRERSGQKGEGKLFGSIDEVKIAYENNKVGLHAVVNVRHNGKWYKNTTAGRAIFNAIIPEELGYYDEMISKKRLSFIIGESFVKAGNEKTVKLLDNLKDIGFKTATKSGISISISDIIIPDEKHNIIDVAEKEVEKIQGRFNRHILTEGERYNKVIDVWTKATSDVAAEMMKGLKSDDEGFNSVYMMADSGARGSGDQIKQLAGMRGLMAKPRKSMVGGGEIIESPIQSNFKEGLSVMEYFISTHGARKGLADTALKTADAGYLTRRLVDVAQDVVISELNCKTINGITVADLKEGEEVVESLSERILGRTSSEKIIIDGKTILKAGEVFDEHKAKFIVENNVNSVKIKSILTCESRRGVCAKCYGWDLTRRELVTIGTAVGIIAAQSIGEPGTQLTLRTFHIGGTATRIVEESDMKSRHNGIATFNDEYQSAKTIDEDGEKVVRCLTRNSKLRIVDSKDNVLEEYNVPYGANVNIKDNAKVKKSDILFSWDPYTDLILARQSGIIKMKDFIEGDTYQEEAVDGGKKQKVVTESKDRRLSPQIEIYSKDGDILSGGTILPVKATLVVNDGQDVTQGQTLVKIQKDVGKTRDITGGLPRVAELFEARKPANPAVVSEINGTVEFGEIKRGVRKVSVTPSTGKSVIYKIPYGKHVVVHEGDFITAGTALCEGAISPSDILTILGPNAVREYLVNEIQEVYRLQGVGINDKHIEVIVNQMMKKIIVNDPGDTSYLPGERLDKTTLFNDNDYMKGMVVIDESGDSNLEVGIMISQNEVKELNKEFKTQDKNLVKFHKAKSATFEPILMGITQSSLNTTSFISAASFQETTRVLTDAATASKTDHLLGLKENVALGRLIPAGTGFPGLQSIQIEQQENQEED